MRDVSDAFNRAAMNGNVIARVECYMTDGDYVEFGPQDIMQGGVSFTSATSNSGSFGIGCAVIGRCTIRLLNDHRQLNGLHLSNARIIPYIGALVDNSIEWLEIGQYWIEPFDIFDDIVSLSCLDALSRMELPCPSVTGPVTLGEMAYYLCDNCGLTLATTTFPHSDYIIEQVPDLTSKSCIDVLSYVAQVAGCYAVADEYGQVCLKWYEATLLETALDGGGFHFEVDSADGGGFHFDVDHANGGVFVTPYSVTALRSFSAGVTPHEVTGLAVSDVDGTQHVSGVDGYVLHIHDNPLIESDRAEDVAANVSPHVLGASLRQVRVSMPGSPAMQAGDPITVIDRFGEEYDFWATSISWSASGTLTASCDVESSSPLVRTYRRQEYGAATVDPIDIEGIMVKALNKPLANMTSIGVFNDISGKFDDLNADVGNLNSAISGINTTIGGINTAISGINGDISNINGTLADVTGDIGNYTSGSTIATRLDNLENSSSVGQWIIQVNGVAQSTGTINFVT